MKFLVLFIAYNFPPLIIEICCIDRDSSRKRHEWRCLIGNLIAPLLVFKFFFFFLHYPRYKKCCLIVFLWLTMLIWTKIIVGFLPALLIKCFLRIFPWFANLVSNRPASWTVTKIVIKLCHYPTINSHQILIACNCLHTIW